MKIALCLHGLFNSTTDSTSNGTDGYFHIKKHILDNNDVDVFIHTWDGENNQKILDLYKPKQIIFEEQVDFFKLITERKINTLQFTPRSPQNVLSHFYSISKVFNLLYEKNTKYDIVIKSRFDLGRINRNSSGPGKHNPYPVQCINFKTDIQNGKIYMANWNHFNMGPADMWFYGDYLVMEKFRDLYDELDSQFYLNSDFHKFAFNIENNLGDLSNSIAFYKWWMIKNNLWNNRINLETTWE